MITNDLDNHYLIDNFYVHSKTFQNDLNFLNVMVV